MVKDASKKRPGKVTIGGRDLTVSKLIDELFMFMRERHNVHLRRIAGEEVWTEDPILQEFKFTNIFRVFDRNTQFILREVIPHGPSDPTETCFRVILFRVFNRIDTWEHLTKQLGTLTWEDFDIDKYESVLRQISVVHGHAYFIPAPKLGGSDNMTNHLRLVHLLMTLKLASHLQEFCHLKDAVCYICLFPSMGQFTGFQMLLDLNMTNVCSFSEDEWAACGPGSSAGLQRIFGKNVKGVESEAIQYLFEHQHEYWNRLELEPPRMHPSRKGVSFVDLEHSVCEFDKYCRQSHPEIRVGRTKIKKRYEKSGLPYTADLPEKWTKKVKVISPGPPPAPEMNGDEPLYHVSHIIAESSSGKRFLVRWLGYFPEDDTWEDAKNLNDGAADVLAAWQAKKQQIADTAVALSTETKVVKRVGKRQRDRASETRKKKARI